MERKEKYINLNVMLSDNYNSSRNVNVSGLLSLCDWRLDGAKRPNSINRVLVSCEILQTQYNYVN